MTLISGLVDNFDEIQSKVSESNLLSCSPITRESSIDGLIDLYISVSNFVKPTKKATILAYKVVLSAIWAPKEYPAIPIL